MIPVVANTKTMDRCLTVVWLASSAAPQENVLTTRLGWMSLEMGARGMHQTTQVAQSTKTMVRCGIVLLRVNSAHRPPHHHFHRRPH